MTTAHCRAALVAPPLRPPARQRRHHCVQPAREAPTRHTIQTQVHAPMRTRLPFWMRDPLLRVVSATFHLILQPGLRIQSP